MLVFLLLIVFYIFLAIFAILISYSIWWYLTIPRNLPPGPIGLPFVGCFPWVRSWSAHETLTKWSKLYGDLFSFYQGSKLIVVLAGADIIDEALVKQSDAFSGRPFLMGIRPKAMKPKHGINSAEGPLWREQRQFAVKALKDFGVGRQILEPKIVEEMEHLLESIRNTNGQPFDPKPFISNAVSNVICSMIFGHRFPLNSDLRDQLDKLNYRASQSRRNTLSAQSIFPWYQYYYPPGKRQLKRFIQDGEDIMHFLQKEIDLCKESFDPDIEPSCYVHAFTKAQRTGSGQFFTDTQLRSATFDLFLAGTDTTVSTLRWAIYYICKYPEIQDRVRNEIRSELESRLPSYADRSKLPYTEAVLMEVHRAASILPLSVMHRTSAPARLRDYDLPEWTYVLPLLWAVHRNEKYYPNPDRFDPSRFIIENDGDGKIKLRKDLPLIPFSVGKRACLGEPLARMELFSYFTVMLQHFYFSFPLESDKSVELDSTVGFIRSPVSFQVCAKEIV